MKIHNEHLLGKLSLSLVSSLLIPLGWIQYYFSSNPFSKPDGIIVNVEDLFLAVLVNLILITQLVFFPATGINEKELSGLLYCCG